MPRHENKTTPTVIGQWLYRDASAIEVGSDAWYEWLEQDITFYVAIPGNSFTARCERRGPAQSPFWYAFRHVGRKQHKLYLGKPSDLSLERLVKIAQVLAEKVRVANA